MRCFNKIRYKEIINKSGKRCHMIIAYINGESYLIYYDDEENQNSIRDWIEKVNSYLHDKLNYNKLDN